MTIHDDKSVPDPRQGKRSGKSVLSFMRRLRERFFLRFHMTLILTATGLSGLLVSKLLILLQVENIIVRYPITVLCSYLAFFLFVKLWLVYMSASQAFNGPNVAGDVLSDLPNISGGGSGPDVSLPKFGGGGGGTGGGGGATGDFDGPATNVQALFVPPRVADPASGAGNSVGDAVSGVFDLDDAGVILIAIGVLLTAIFGAAIYLVYIAPHILSEAAFNFLLGTSLIRSYRKINHPDWMGSVFQDTYKPFVGVLLISFAAAWVIHAYAPNITKISDLFTR